MAYCKQKPIIQVREKNVQRLTTRANHRLINLCTTTIELGFERELKCYKYTNARPQVTISSFRYRSDDCGIRLQHNRNSKLNLCFPKFCKQH